MEGVLNVLRGCKEKEQERERENETKRDPQMVIVKLHILQKKNLLQRTKDSTN